MVITIRFRDWAIFFFVFFCWGADHWFTTYGIKTLTELYKFDLILHTIECFVMFLLLIATSYIVFKLYYKSFFLGTLSLAYLGIVTLLSYFWNSLLMVNHLSLAAFVALVSFIITVIGSVMLFQ